MATNPTASGKELCDWILKSGALNELMAKYLVQVQEALMNERQPKVSKLRIPDQKNYRRALHICLQFLKNKCMGTTEQCLRMELEEIPASAGARKNVIMKSLGLTGSGSVIQSLLVQRLEELGKNTGKAGSFVILSEGGEEEEDASEKTGEKLSIGTSDSGAELSGDGHDIHGSQEDHSNSSSSSDSHQEEETKEEKQTIDVDEIFDEICGSSGDEKSGDGTQKEKEQAEEEVVDIKQRAVVIESPPGSDEEHGRRSGKDGKPLRKKSPHRPTPKTIEERVHLADTGLNKLKKIQRIRSPRKKQERRQRREMRRSPRPENEEEELNDPKYKKAKANSSSDDSDAAENLPFPAVKSESRSVSSQHPSDDSSDEKRQMKRGEDDSSDSDDEAKQSLLAFEQKVAAIVGQDKELVQSPRPLLSPVKVVLRRYDSDGSTSSDDKVSKSDEEEQSSSDSGDETREGKKGTKGRSGKSAKNGKSKRKGDDHSNESDSEEVSSDDGDGRRGAKGRGKSDKRAGAKSSHSKRARDGSEGSSHSSEEYPSSSESDDAGSRRKHRKRDAKSSGSGGDSESHDDAKARKTSPSTTKAGHGSRSSEDTSSDADSDNGERRKDKRGATSSNEERSSEQGSRTSGSSKQEDQESGASGQKETSSPSHDTGHQSDSSSSSSDSDAKNSGKVKHHSSDSDARDKTSGSTSDKEAFEQRDAKESKPGGAVEEQDEMDIVASIRIMEVRDMPDENGMSLVLSFTGKSATYQTKLFDKNTTTINEVFNIYGQTGGSMKLALMKSDDIDFERLGFALLSFEELTSQKGERWIKLFSYSSSESCGEVKLSINIAPNPLYTGSNGSAVKKEKSSTSSDREDLETALADMTKSPVQEKKTNQPSPAQGQHKEKDSIIPFEEEQKPAPLPQIIKVSSGSSDEGVPESIIATSVALSSSSSMSDSSGSDSDGVKAANASSAGRPNIHSEASSGLRDLRDGSSEISIQKRSVNLSLSSSSSSSSSDSDSSEDDKKKEKEVHSDEDTSDPGSDVLAIIEEISDSESEFEMSQDIKDASVEPLAEVALVKDLSRQPEGILARLILNQADDLDDD